MLEKVNGLSANFGRISKLEGSQVIKDGPLILENSFKKSSPGFLGTYSSASFVTKTAQIYYTFFISIFFHISEDQVMVMKDVPVDQLQEVLVPMKE